MPLGFRNEMSILRVSCVHEVRIIFSLSGFIFFICKSSKCNVDPVFCSLCEFSISVSLSGYFLFICWYSKLNVDPVGVVENGFRICSVILLPFCLFSKRNVDSVRFFLNDEHIFLSLSVLFYLSVNFQKEMSILWVLSNMDSVFFSA